MPDDQSNASSDQSLPDALSATRLPAWRSTPVAGVAAALLVALTLALRLYWRSSLIAPIGFAAPIVLISLFRRRRFLWLASLAFFAGTAVRFFGPGSLINETFWQKFRDCCFGDFNLLLVVVLCDRWIASQSATERHAGQLETANHELTTREEEIARQNEELQTQTEELERQHEELSVSNEELGHREKSLQVLLALSRALSVQRSPAEMMQRTCDALSVLLEYPAHAAAICERDGDRLVVRCHAGFGLKGIQSDSIPLAQSFAALILTRGQTGYLENLSTRPDLQIPQPIEGDPMVSVLASPLRIGRDFIGTVEIYSRTTTVWNQTQTALMESLASQASLSLESAHLFESINAERQRFLAVLRTAPVGIAVVSVDGKDLRLNPAGATMFGCEPDENLLLGKTVPPWELLRQGTTLPAGQSPLFRALAGNEVPAEEMEVAVNGKRLVVLKNARPIRTNAGQVVGAVAAFTDITPLKDLERQLDERRREAEAISVRKTHFLAAVSHDIRTPANAINLLAELIGRTWQVPALAGEIPELTRELKASSASLVELLSDVLDIAHYDAGKIELQLAEFNAADLVEEQVRNMRRLALAKNLSLEAMAPRLPDSADQFLVKSDRMKLSRVLTNLIGNAIKFTERGSVIVRAEDSGEAVSIRVTDTGVGVLPEMQQHIFEEFVQLRNPERDRNKGTGLGLSICRRLVDAMGGTLSVASVVGQGSTFTVTLPKRPAVAGAPALVEAMSQSGSAC